MRGRLTYDALVKADSSIDLFIIPTQQVGFLLT